MDLGLENKNAAITGASQGIGFAIAEALAQEGTNVAIGARGEEKLEAARGRLAAHGTKVVAVKADFSSEGGCRSFVESVTEALGTLDILVNNVGGMIPGTLDSLTEDDWERVLNVNLMAVYDQACPICDKPATRASSTSRVSRASSSCRAH